VDLHASNNPGRLKADVIKGWLRAMLRPRWWWLRGWRPGAYTRPLTRSSFGSRYLQP
jgi:hypothetical protein